MAKQREEQREPSMFSGRCYHHDVDDEGDDGGYVDYDSNNIIV